METFKKRHKEMRRLERKGIRPLNARKSRRAKSPEIESESDRDTELTENAAASDPAADLSTID